MRNLLITGGAGFIGTNLVKYFYNKYKITIFDNFSRETSIKNKVLIKNNFPNVEIVEGRISDSEAVEKVVKGKDVIVHTAAQVAVTNSVNDPRTDFEINALGTFNVLDAARKQENKPVVIFFSTNKVYGDNVNYIPIEELKTRYDFSGELKGKGLPETFSIDAKEHTPYGCSKLTADIYAQDFAKIFDVPTVVNRCSCMYGEEQYGTTDQGWLAFFIISAIKNRPLTIYGDGKQVRDALYVGDVCKLIEREIENIEKVKGEVFNVGGGADNTISLLELLDEIGKYQEKPKIFYGDWRPADQKVFYCDISKAKRLLGWTPLVSPAEGVKRLYEWAKKNVI